MKGDLAVGVVPALLRELYAGRRNGTLHFRRGNETQRVRVRGGHIVNAHTNIVEERLGEILVSRGLLSAPDLARATEVVVREKKRLGEVLVELGLIDRSGLEDAVAMHVHGLLAKVFAWNDGTYEFEEEDESPGEELTLKLSTAELILEAVGAIQDPDVVRYQLGDLDRPLALSEDPLLRFQQLALSPTDGFVLSRIDGSLTAHEIEQMIPLPPEEVRKSLLGLVSTGLVEFHDRPESGETGKTAPRPAASRPSPSPRAGAKPNASPSPPPPASTADAPPPRSPPSPSAVKAETAPSAASTPPRRATAEAPPPRPSSPPPAAAAPPAPPATEPPARPAASAEAAAAADPADERRAEVLEAYEGLKTRNHFEVLGLPRASSAADVKEAYFRLARRFHPDVHHGASLGDLRDKLEKVFIRLGEAYDVLRDTDRRRDYEERLGRMTPRAGSAAVSAAPTDPEPPPAPPDPEEEARQRLAALRRAEQLYEKEQYFDAIQLARPLVETVPEKLKLRARMVLARCYLKNPNWTRDAEQILQDAVRDDPKAAAAYELLGALYRDRGLRTRAASMLRRVVELRPDDEEARQQLAALGPDEPPAPPEDQGGGGLLRKIFKRS